MVALAVSSYTCNIRHIDFRSQVTYRSILSTVKSCCLCTAAVFCHPDLIHILIYYIQHCIHYSTLFNITQHTILAISIQIVKILSLSFLRISIRPNCILYTVIGFKNILFVAHFWAAYCRLHVECTLNFISHKNHPIQQYKACNRNITWYKR